MLFDGVFGLPSPRNTQKRDKPKPRNNRFWNFCVDFSATNLSTHFLSQNAKKQKSSEELTWKILSIFCKVVDTGFLQKHFGGVFEFTFCRGLVLNGPRGTACFYGV
jgi:hypothetical protein